MSNESRLPWRTESSKIVRSWRWSELSNKTAVNLIQPRFLFRAPNVTLSSRRYSRRGPNLIFRKLFLTSGKRPNFTRLRGLFKLCLRTSLAFAQQMKQGNHARKVKRCRFNHIHPTLALGSESNLGTGVMVSQRLHRWDTPPVMSKALRSRSKDLRLLKQTVLSI